MTRHLYTNGDDYFSAASPEEAEALWREWLEESIGDDPADYDPCEWREMSDRRTFQVFFESPDDFPDVPEVHLRRLEYDDGEHSFAVLMSCKEWAKHMHGFVASHNV